MIHFTEISRFSGSKSENFSEKDRSWSISPSVLSGLTGPVGPTGPTGPKRSVNGPVQENSNRSGPVRVQSRTGPIGPCKP